MSQRDQLSLLLGNAPAPARAPERLCDGAWLLTGFALDVDVEVQRAVRAVWAEAPARRMRTPGGREMSAALSSCGRFGWVTDERGYRYAERDPETGRPWPTMPAVLRALATRAASAAGFEAFAPDSCLINRYGPDARMSLHRDDTERAFDAPIVSVTLGASATFAFGGGERTDPVQKVPLHHGDVLVWGGPSRLRYHGVSPPHAAGHPAFGADRVNLTFRRAG